jgi:hypothetical protein
MVCFDSVSGTRPDTDTISSCPPVSGQQEKPPPAPVCLRHNNLSFPPRRKPDKRQQAATNFPLLPVRYPAVALATARGDARDGGLIYKTENKNKQPKESICGHYQTSVQ